MSRFAVPGCQQASGSKEIRRLTKLSTRFDKECMRAEVLTPNILKIHKLKYFDFIQTIMSDLGSKPILAGTAQAQYNDPRSTVDDHRHTQFGVQQVEHSADTNFYRRIIGAMQPPRRSNSGIIGVLNTKGFPTDQGSEPSLLITENASHQITYTRDMVMLMQKNSVPGTPLPLFMESSNKDSHTAGLFPTTQNSCASMYKNYGASRGQYLMNFANESAVPVRSISLPADILNLGGRKEHAVQNYAINPQDKCFLLHRDESAAPPVTVVLEGRSICQRICLQDHNNYATFAQALRTMFADIVSAGCHAFQTYNAGECNLANAIPGYVIAYEDIEGDLLLAGDLSWKDFVRAAKRIRILPAKNPVEDHRGRKS